MFGRLFVEVKHLARSIGLLSTRYEWGFQRGVRDAGLKILCNRCTGLPRLSAGQTPSPIRFLQEKLRNGFSGDGEVPVRK